MSQSQYVTDAETTTESCKVAIDTHGNVFKVPDYTIKDILSAIPPECYNRKLAVSLYYVFRDIAIMAGIGYFANVFAYPYVKDLHVAARFVYWAFYGYVQGLFGTGLWVLAHECGHQAFSDYGAVNDFVGWVLHSYLLVPYFSWKYTHSKHHKATGHITRDMVFVPKTKEDFVKSRGILADIDEFSEDSPIRTLIELLTQQLGGWIYYLLTNVTGQPYPDVPKWKWNHFWPSSPVFDDKDYIYILLSDLGILTQSLVLKIWYDKFGGWSVFINWFVPYIWVNHWLVFITYLQHTDASMPHYEADQWSFAKGAAATIDRQFGFIGPHIFHDIIETHVLHHYCSRIPFYNARPASEAIKKVMGEHYRFNDENMWVSLWKSARTCQYVDDADSKGVYMFRNVNNVGVGTGKKKN
ncbi:uncharacterized protein KLLA0_F07095g [Kluyveromyces lactis]|uniref:KLLA0F07095p n=1 Tax=Kluyveromyces lactis (strain ATCC 8585 / CBS 2359 / DSM 70799 / NBRC 1267 / NRRL Y-1140 / WM37) TaxID=284590 RepID=Q6CKY7_KLULA|nr:uncharacterized protein KLLA0_F07095g [Kluyveromyces lactis]CAG98110.1 KLLA0F07095p [Kluyveromyces lactis]|eukprot:XP_455402.1 uncharacterized protein KLLA0_F07095g [Kluyveromyces lactis]